MIVDRMNREWNAELEGYGRWGDGVVAGVGMARSDYRKIHILALEYEKNES